MDKNLHKFIYEKLIRYNDKWDDNFWEISKDILNEYLQVLSSEKEGLEAAKNNSLESFKELSRTVNQEEIKEERKAALVSSEDILNYVEDANKKLRTLLGTAKKVMSEEHPDEIKTIAGFFCQTIPDILKLKNKAIISTKKRIADLKEVKEDSFYRLAINRQQQDIERYKTSIGEEIRDYENRLQGILSKIGIIEEIISGLEIKDKH